MGYVSYSRGFKSGGFDMRGNAAVYPGTENGYNSETADSYEVGIKTTLFDDTLLLNLTVFYDPYNNAQIQLQDFVEYKGAPTNLTAVLNAGKQINQGVEFESVWRPIRPLTLVAQRRLPRFLLREFPDQLRHIHVPGRLRARRGVVNVADENRPLNAPFWNVSENTTYTWDLSSGYAAGARRLRLAQLHQSRGLHAEPDRSAGVRGAQCRPRVHDREQGWRFSIDGKNLTEPVLPRRRLRLRPSADRGCQLLHRWREPDRLLWPPRTVAATVTYHF